MENEKQRASIGGLGSAPISSSWYHSGAGSGEKHFKQGCRCYNQEGYTLDEKDEKPIASMNLRNWAYTGNIL